MPKFVLWSESPFHSLFHRNSKAANWSPSKIRFFDSARRSKDQPGPGAYNPSDIESTNGSYIVSNFRNGGNVKFIKPKIGLRSKTPLNQRLSKFRLSCPLSCLSKANLSRALKLAYLSDFSMPRPEGIFCSKQRDGQDKAFSWLNKI